MNRSLCVEKLQKQIKFLLQTYRRERVAEAIRKGQLSSNKKDVACFMANIARLPERDVSPAPNSDDDEEAKVTRKKRQRKHMLRMTQMAQIKRKVQDKVCPDWRQKAYEEGLLETGVLRQLHRLIVYYHKQ